jgi:hypothetical protein
MAANTNLSVNLDVAKRLDITCRKGDTFELVISATDSSGNDIDFTAYTDAVLQVRPTDDSATLVLEFAVSDFDLTVGSITANKTAAEMAAVDSGIYVYDLELTDSVGKVVTWFYGLFKINDDVTS